jgi:hypothetical protein
MNDAMSGTASDDDEEAIGLYFLFGHDLWTTSGNNTDTAAFKTRFETLVAGGSIKGDDLLKQIPSGMTNKFDIEARTQQGFKFEWKDTANMSWHIHGHEADGFCRKFPGRTCEAQQYVLVWFIQPTNRIAAPDTVRLSSATGPSGSWA